MTNKWISLLVAFGFLATPTHALELPKGAKKVVDADAVGIFVNRKLNLTIYNGKKSVVVPCITAPMV